MTDMRGVGDVYAARCYSQVNMAPKEFFSLLKEQEDGSANPYAYSWSSTVSEFDMELVSEIQPVEAVMYIPPDFQPERSHEFRETVVWIAQNSSTTPLHFDLSHNFFTQVYGSKHFLLFPPQTWEQLYLYPHLHPGSQASQMQMNALDYEKFPLAKNLRGFEVVLEEGDVLYIPPLWFHQVTSLSTSISISVWSHYQAATVWEKMIDESKLPIKAEWTPLERVAALRLFLESLTENLNMGEAGNIAAFVDFALLDSRYKHIGQNPAEVEVRNHYCFDEAAENKVFAQVYRLSFLVQCIYLVCLFVCFFVCLFLCYCCRVVVCDSNCKRQTS